MRAIRIASLVAAELFDEQAWRALVISHVQVAREDGILVALQLTLSQLASIRVYQGDLEAAEGVVGECEAISPIAAGKELTVEESYRDALGCPAS